MAGQGKCLVTNELGVQGGQERGMGLWVSGLGSGEPWLPWMSSLSWTPYASWS